jgi:hypothetical protein
MPCAYAKQQGKETTGILKGIFTPHIEGRQQRNFGQGKGDSCATVRADGVVAGKFGGMRIGVESKGCGGMGGGGWTAARTNMCVCPCCHCMAAGVRSKMLAQAVGTGAGWRKGLAQSSALFDS